MKYAKTIVAAGVAGLTVLGTALSDNSISPSEWLTIGIAIAGALGVYAIPNASAKDSRTASESYHRPGV